MSTKAVIVREGTYKRTIVVVLPDGLTAADLLAALSSKKADQVGDFFICPDTFSVRIEDNRAEFPDENWQILSADEATFGGDLTDVGEELKAGAKRDALEAAAQATLHSFKHQLSSLNESAFALLLKGDICGSRKIVSAASTLHTLAGGGESDEAVFLLSLKSFNCSASGQHKAAWRYGRLAVSMARRVHGDGNAMYGMTINNIAEGQIDAGNYARAEKMLTEGTAIIDKTIEDKSVDLNWAAGVKADAMRNYQRLLQLTGRSES